MIEVCKRKLSIFLKKFENIWDFDSQNDWISREMEALTRKETWNFDTNINLNKINENVINFGYFEILELQFSYLNWFFFAIKILTFFVKKKIFF